MIKTLSFLLLVLFSLLFIKTRIDMQPIPETLDLNDSTIQKPQLLDKNLHPITITYKNHWNLHDVVPLHTIPEFLQQAFIVSEDKRFYQHHGIDWIARLHAVWQNIFSMTKIRGASTISEQTIKMLHPRPRTIWSRWLEGWEAVQLEKHFNKNDILEFYLNQVPYSAQRRGVVQAARYYFNRDLDTLNQQEMIMLAVLVRAPSRLDPIKHPGAAKPAVSRLAKNLEVYVRGKHRAKVQMVGTRPIKASHFANYIYRIVDHESKKIHTTLDRDLQQKAQQFLEQRIKDLETSNVKNGAVLIVDHQTGEIMSWVVAGDSDPDYPGSAIDAVTAPRQPGSTLKPLLYTLALENGFTAATLIDDSPLSESVGHGLHTYHNYSRTNYGPISLREALGNSLNIPAVKVLQKIGTENFLHTLHELGIKSLQNHPDIYGDGLALGNGEITLYELVQAYTTLARHGQFKPLSAVHEENYQETKRIFTPEATSLIANILSDPWARRREFGRGGLLDFPTQTAVKTGTSSNYHDAWAIGFNHRYTAGVWMGNMDRTSMKKITGSKGPAHVLRSIFSELNKRKETKPLYLSPKLVQTEICRETGLVPIPQKTCSPYNEWFIPGTIPTLGKTARRTRNQPLRIQQPSPNLQLAMDPRIPDDKEFYQFSLNQQQGYQHVQWILDDQLLEETSNGEYRWKLTRGKHKLKAVIKDGNHMIETQSTRFLVK